jgi:hypothetical protein
MNSLQRRNAHLFKEKTMALPLIAAGVVARAALKKAATEVAKKAGSKGATKVGQKVGQKTLESTKVPKYPSAKGKTVKSKVDGKVKTTSESGRKTSKSAKEVEYKKKNLTEKQRLGSFKAQETKRYLYLGLSNNLKEV